MFGLLPVASLSFAFAARPALPRAPTPAMSVADAGKTFRPAQFWEDETATLLDIANVMGRWESSSEWTERSEFSVVQVTRDENMAQAASLERFEYAQRNKLAERVALLQNVPKLPFTNEKLAASFGKSVEEMNAMPVSQAAMGIVYDALAESKSSLVPQKTIDARRDRWMAAEGGLDEGALAAGLYKSRLAVTVGFILLGKGQLYGAVVVARVVLDVTGAFDAVQEALVPFAEPLYWVLSLAVAAYAVRQSMEVATRTSDFETMSKEEAEAEEERLKGDPAKSPTVFSRFGKQEE